MTDRELLEAAAKAAGLHIDRWHGDGGDIWKGKPLEVGKEAVGTYVRWNPLTDDGDALRLAVKLGVRLRFYPDEGMIEAYCIQGGFRGNVMEEPGSLRNGPEPYAATRRAIVRAAAALAAREAP